MKIISALFYVALATGQQAADKAPLEPSLRDELLAMRAADQEARTQSSVTAEAGATVDRRNTARLKEIVDRHGWPTYSLVGRDGADAAFLLAQHADMDPAFQKRASSLMEPLVASGEATASNYAYLRDRTHAPQRFGTQGRCVGKSEWAPREIEQPEEVDVRRASVGLPPMHEYVKVVSQFCTRSEE